MRQIFFLFVLFSIRGSIVNGQIHIKGKLYNFELPKVIYYKPFNGFFNFNINPENAIISKNGEFEINENFDNGFICLFAGNIPIYLAVGNNDTVSISFDYKEVEEKGVSFISFKGKNSEGHSLFNSIYEKPMEKYQRVVDITDNISEIPSKFLLDTVKNAITFYTRQLSLLSERKKIDKNFYSLACASIKCNLLNEFLKPFIRKTAIINKFSNNEIKALFIKIFEYYPPISKENFSAFLGDHYISSYLEVVNDQYIKTKSYGAQYSDISHDFLKYTNLTDKSLQENIWGSSLYFLKKLFPDEIGEKDYIVFKSLFTNSSYNPYLENLYEMDRLPEPEMNEKVKFIDKSIPVNCLHDLKGNYYFVDLWASWCVPCKQEFSFNNKIDSFLSEKKIMRLYISIDDSISVMNWKKNISRYNLTGYHILANQQLITDIKSKIYGKEEYFAIPRYFLLNSEGEVLCKELPRPSEKSFYSRLGSILSNIKKL